MIWLLVFGILMTILGSFTAGVVSGPRVRNAWQSLDDKRRARKPRPAAAYVPRHAPTLPRRKPLVNRQPWQTAEMPAIRVPAAQLALDPGDGLDEVGLVRPYAPSNEQTRELYHGGDWGTRPELEVREAERLAGVMLP